MERRSAAGSLLSGSDVINEADDPAGPDSVTFLVIVAGRADEPFAAAGRSA